MKFQDFQKTKRYLKKYLFWVILILPSRVLLRVLGKKKSASFRSLYRVNTLIIRGDVSAVQGYQQSHVDQIIHRFASYLNCNPKQLVLSGSGGASLQASIRSFQSGIGSLCEISNNTCTAAAQAVIATGSIPLLMPLNPNNLENLWDVSDSESGRKIDRIRISTIFAGRRQLPAIPIKRPPFIIEDSCLYFPPKPNQANFNCKDSDVVIFSFGFSKPISVGEGSLILCESEELALEIRSLLNWGESSLVGHRDLTKPAWNGRFPSYSLELASSLLKHHMLYNDLAHNRLYKLLESLQYLTGNLVFPKLEIVQSLDLSRSFNLIFSQDTSIDFVRRLKGDLLSENFNLLAPIFDNLNDMQFFKNGNYHSWLKFDPELFDEVERNYSKKFLSKNDLTNFIITLPSADLTIKRRFDTLIRTLSRSAISRR